MSEKEMSELVDELRTAIADSGGIGEEDRGRLDELLRRIELEVDEDEDDDPNIVEHIEDALGRFEADHVGLVQTINRIANALSAGGI